MYRVIGYQTDHYERIQIDERCRDLNRVRIVASRFLSEPGRKVVIYCYDGKMMHNWTNRKRKRRKVYEATSVSQLPKW